MSFLSNLFGGTFEKHFAEGKALFEAETFGEAKLCFERAVSRKKGAPPEDVAKAEAMLARCKTQLAEMKIADADQVARGGELEAAVELLNDAAEISDAPEITAAIKERLKSYEAEDTRRLVDDAEELSEEELMTIIAGTWTDAQAEEYAAMPEGLEEALLAAHDGAHEKAVAIIKEIISRADLPVLPRYLYLELGREEVLQESLADALEHLDVFLKATEDDSEALETRVMARNLRSTCLAGLERMDEAEEELRSAANMMPGDYRTFLRLGVFLRSQEKFDAAIDAMEQAKELMGQMQPDFTVIRELGFTYLRMKKKDEARDCLNAVIEHLASKGEHSQFDPETAVALAALREERGELMMAADLYRHLAVGYDTANHFVYNSQAARLLKAAGAEASLVDRYVTRARELVASAAEKALLDEIEAG
jgi:tetratricopeptide (TPR) repeat protein